ncbi:MAG: T9SS type A sorting domain-containing protein [Chitinispirillales bacterium]|jgi:hypothetical protein|nr:T9SS type A sorting domain-containing protein [Chitinispirillales bacterium]
MNFKKSSAAAIVALLTVSMCFGWKSPDDWKKDAEYKGSWQDGAGDTVKYGKFGDKDLYWWAKFAADSSSIPGEFAAEGGTSPWVLINSLSAANNGGRPNFKAVTWNGANGSAALNNIGAGEAKVPTWRDAANGAYSITLDDFGGMPFELSVKPGWDAAKEFPKIKMAWGVIVGQTEEADWKKAIEMVGEGHEIFNHTIDHTSSADQWQIYYPGKTVSQTDPAVPPSVRGLEVVGTWKITAKSKQGVTQSVLNFGPDSWSGAITDAMLNSASSFGNPVNHGILNGSYWVDGAPDGGHPFTITAESEMVTVEWPAYWTGYDPSTSVKWNDPSIRITKKANYKGNPIEEVTLPSGQKVYVAYTNYNPNADEWEGYQEGYIAATGVQWFEEGLLKSDYPYYYNGARITTDWISPGCENPPGCPTSGPGWSVTQRDQGRPGFVAKLFCIEGWDGGTGVAGPQTRRNVDTANAIINTNVYKNVKTAGEYFAKGKKSEYLGYPYDAYSEKTHNHLYEGVTYPDAGKFVGARGGAKSGKPMEGDFYHPFRLDFDAFFINDKDWTAPTSDQPKFLVPNNAHVLLGINAMVDSIIKFNGYMIRELHAVADIVGDWYNDDAPDLWPVNNAALNKGGWWGGITKSQLKEHLRHVDTLITAKKLAVYTPSEAVKYRMTANAFNTDANLTDVGDNWKVTLTQKAGETVNDVHKEEISVIVNLGEAVTSLAIAYDGNPTNTDPDNSPRRKPVSMDNDAGKIWSVSINPFKTNDHSALLIKNGEWFGQGVDVDVEGPLVHNSASNVVQNTVRMSFAGIRNGQIALNLRKGNYTAELYNLQGRLISSVKFDAMDGVNVTGLRTNNLAKGLLILNVKQAGASVLQHKIMIK